MQGKYNVPYIREGETMSIERVRAYFSKIGMEERIVELDQSSATVELAAQALGCRPVDIAKTLAFDVEGQTIVIVAAGNARIDNAKYKNTFGKKAKMLHGQEVEERTGHAIGGVCPFGLKDGVKVYLDQSLKPLTKVYPACGSSNSCICLSIEELEKVTDFVAWVDVCK